MTNEDEDTGRESTYARESVVFGSVGRPGLSAKRMGEATDGGDAPRHPALIALGFVAFGVAVIVGLVLVFVYA